MATPAPNALSAVVREIEQHVAASGWDQPPRLFALVETADLLRREPALAARLGQADSAFAPLTPVEQEDLPGHDSLEDLLAGIVWPGEVLGTAIVVERFMLLPTVEADLPSDESAALRWVAAHPERQEVRLAVGVLRDGSRECAMRFRRHDRDDAVLSGPELVPGLSDALSATLDA